MGKLSKVGLIFYGISIAILGLLTIYLKDFPYMLIPPKHHWIPGMVMISYIGGMLLVVAGACIVFEKKARSAALGLGTVLLLIFCFGFIPFQLIASPNYMNLIDWENAEKELALAGGAFVVAGCFPGKLENALNRTLAKLIPFGAVLFSIPMISFGILHFQYAKDVSEYVPAWMPLRLFWTYLAGTGLIASGIAIILNIKAGLAAALLGLMILIWFAILHVPRIVVSPVAYLGSEISSAFIALAYSGIAFTIAGTCHKLRISHV